MATAPKKTSAKKVDPAPAPAPKKASAKKVDPAPAPAPAPKKVTAKKAIPAPVEAAAAKPVSAFMKPLTPSAALAKVVGKAAIPRTEVIKKVWEYIKEHKLQDEANRRMINADAKLKAVFDGKTQVSMFELTKLVNGHLK
jgi:chromatin remodeling complex protein RSC6